MFSNGQRFIGEGFSANHNLRMSFGNFATSQEAHKVGRDLGLSEISTTRI